MKYAIVKISLNHSKLMMLVKELADCLHNVPWLHIRTKASTLTYYVNEHMEMDLIAYQRDTPELTQERTLSVYYLRLLNEDLSASERLAISTLLYAEVIGGLSRFVPDITNCIVNCNDKTPDLIIANLNELATLAPSILYLTIQGYKDLNSLTERIIDKVEAYCTKVGDQLTDAQADSIVEAYTKLKEMLEKVSQL